MVRYSRFLFKNIIVKKGIYALSLLFAVLMIIITYLQADVANRNMIEFIDSISTFTKFYPFIFSTLFTTLIIIYAFKNGEQDGSELLIVAKAIRRWEIIVSKFLITLGFVIVYQSFSFFVYLAAGAFDELADKAMLFRFAGSLAVGGFIIQLLMISLVTLVAAFANKVGTLVFGVMLASVVPIISFILAPVGKGIPYGVKFLEERFLVNSGELASFSAPADGKVFGRKDAEAIIDQKNIYNVQGAESPERSKYEKHLYDTYKDQQWYKKAAYIDIWYQWGGFMSLFMPKDNVKMEHIQDWSPEAKQVDYNLDSPSGSKQSKYFELEMSPALGSKVTTDVKRKIAFYLSLKQLSLDEISGEDSQFDVETIVEDFKKSIETLVLKGYVKNVALGSDVSSNAHPTNVLDATKDDELKAIRFIESIAFMMKERTLSSKIELAGKSLSLPLIAEIRLFQEFDKYTKLEKAKGNELSVFHDGQWLKYKKPQYLMDPGSKDEPWIVYADQKLPIYSSKPFIETEYIIYAWSAIMIMFIAATVTTYFKRDFK